MKAIQTAVIIHALKNRSTGMTASGPFNHSEYIFYRYAGAVGVFDGDGNPVLYAEREGTNKDGKAIHVYTSRHRTEELLTLCSPKGRKELLYYLGDRSLLLNLIFFIIPPRIEYTVTDAVTGEVIGSVVQRSRLIFVKDEWDLISGGKTAGRLVSTRYFLHSIIWPRTYKIVAQDGNAVGTFRQHRKMLNFRYTMKIEDMCMDTRLLVAAGIVITILKATF